MAPVFYPTLFQHLATDYRRNLAVTAGAGTGKTEVLTRRIIKILAQERFLLDRLLVVTFTDKAAVEMKERIYGAIEREFAATGDLHFQKLKDTFLNNYISTFHAFCAALLREYPIEAGIDPYFRVLDETDKLFFLRKSINRSLKELAADKNNPDIQLLSEEFSRTALANSIFEIIQRREDTGPWITDFTMLSWPQFRQRLGKYRDCILREMAYKLYKSHELEAILQKLESLEAELSKDTTASNQKRENLIRLIPLFLTALAPAADGAVDIKKIGELKKEILESARLSGSTPKSWSPEASGIVKGAFVAIRYLLDSFEIDGFEIDESHEKCGFDLLRALARLAEYCLKSYHKGKAAENYLDFQDLQLKVLQLLETEQYCHIREEVRQRFCFIMVDEFQDTNEIQWRIIRKIASEEGETIADPKLFIVGDEKQAIYSFRGGDVSLFFRVRQELLKANHTGGHDRLPFDLTFDSSKNYEGEYREKIADDSLIRAGEIVFSNNFRSAAAPINFFNMFFQDLLFREVYEEYDAKPQLLSCSGNQNEGSVEMLLVDSGNEPADEALSLKQAAAGREPEISVPKAGPELGPHFKEALLIVEKIKEVFLGDDQKYSRVRENARKGRPAVAILLNRRTMIKTYEEALRLNRIDFTVVRGRGFFQRQEIVDLGNLLRFLIDPADDLSLVAFLRSAAGHVSDEGIFLLESSTTRLSKTMPNGSDAFAFKNPDGPSLWEKLTVLTSVEAPSADWSNFSARDQKSLATAATNLTRWSSFAGRLPLVELLRLILNDGGYYVSLSRGGRGAQAISNLEKLLDSARDMSLQEGGDLADFSEWLNERIDYIDEEGEADVDISLGGSVQIMTVHQSKGLEFPMVFVPDLGAGFNLGEKESLYADRVPAAMTVTAEQIIRREIPEISINAPNPEKEWDSEPLLIKRIIKKRLKDKLIAEKKRLFYVAVTRAMDHLVLVGHANFASPAVIQRITYAPLDQLTNWLDWLNRILGLSYHANGLRGEIYYSNKAGKAMRIPYRKFAAQGSPAGMEAEYRTEFPVEE
jgi:ATP-dependent helicase/nuclease subunit A